MDDNFSFSKSLAAEIGLNNAIFLQDIAYWMGYNKSQGMAYEDGRYWTFSTHEEICERHPYWTKNQVRKIIKDCEEAGYLITGNYNKNRYDHTKWYTLGDKLYDVISHIDVVEKPHRSVTEAKCRSGEKPTSINISNNIINKDICGDASVSSVSVEDVSQKKSVPRKEFSKHGWVKLTDEEYARLVKDLGKKELDRCIEHIDESAQINGNKYKWKDWNLVIRKCSRQKWHLSREERAEIQKQKERDDRFADVI